MSDFVSQSRWPSVSLPRTHDRLAHFSSVGRGRRPGACLSSQTCPRRDAGRLPLPWRGPGKLHKVPTDTAPHGQESLRRSPVSAARPALPPGPGARHRLTAADRCGLRGYSLTARGQGSLRPKHRRLADGRRSEGGCPRPPSPPGYRTGPLSPRLPPGRLPVPCSREARPPTP